MTINRLTRLNVLLWVTLSLILHASPVLSEVIQGFRDLQFGMTKSEVQALEKCSTSSECLYELAGKNRYVHTSYTNTSQNQSSQRLAKISIDMGRFTDEWYGELQIKLQDQYQLTHDLTGHDIEAFQNEHLSELTSGYENGQVLLKVIRRKFGNLILKVVYQNKDLAAKTLKQFNTFP